VSDPNDLKHLITWRKKKQKRLPSFGEFCR
jgi:hypothetical protein